ncbi:hypothetical protein MLD38_024381 [Melastoma candidum]|uniref:Uncharacterized protein n=1 Tax=Melastoma candidum TaxID=119954 RepID=A0ACB9NT32_9MYRT|nr:hypothetical protein MLD38_024381 [Melastoma candidum]
MTTHKGFSHRGECSGSIHGERSTMAAYYHSDNLFHLPSLLPQSYSRLFNGRSTAPSQLKNLEGGQQADHQFQIISDATAVSELGKTTMVQEIMDAKALAASKSHSEAERRRRERINNHLARLRTLLPSTTKTDKASLLAEVIQHLKELKREASLITETIPIPTEADELIMDECRDDSRGFVIRASLCCDDRPDLVPDLIKALRGLQLRVLKTEITTIGGRIRNVLFVTREGDRSSTDEYTDEWHWYLVSSIQEALKAVMKKDGGGTGNKSPTGNVKRQRTSAVSIIEHGAL